jgi:tetratricopeptide (TPR) repeat protein
MKNTNQGAARPTLSVAMIVCEAADVLGTTLDSIRAIADEIVVADTGSVDCTVEIARQGADIVTQIEWQDSFALARNERLRHVTGEWVLWLDAGETIDDTVALQLQHFIEESADLGKAYVCFVQRPAAAARNCSEQIGQVRLLPNRPGLEFTGRVREAILPSVLAAGLGLDMLDCLIRRAACGDEAAKRNARARRNLNLANLAAHDGPETTGLLLARAEALGQLGRWQNSGEAYRRALSAAERGSSEMLEAYYGLLTAMDASSQVERRLGEGSLKDGSLGSTALIAETQLNTCLEALDIYPLDSQLLCGMGGYLLRSGRLDLAERSYAMAVAHGKADPMIWHLAELADVAVVCLSLVKQLLGDARRAEEIIRSALAERPASLRLRRQMIEMCVKAGRESEALTHCRMLPDDAPYRNELPAVVRGAVLAAAKKSVEALPMLTTAYDAGCRDPLCLRWLAAAHLAEGDLIGVKIIADEWERLEAGNLEIAAFRQAIAARAEGRNNEPKGGTQRLTSGVAASSRVPARRVDVGSPGQVPLETPLFTPHPTSPKL